jgi:hypothetical protein
MTNDNIFSGLKVVDLASFIAGPRRRSGPLALMSSAGTKGDI